MLLNVIGTVAIDWLKFKGLHLSQCILCDKMQLDLSLSILLAVIDGRLFRPIKKFLSSIILFLSIFDKKILS